jgi:hypothetical protein
LSGVVVPAAQAQRGVGEPVGVARQAVKPETVTLVGTVTKVETGPCENTTGRSPLGTHFSMEGAKGKVLNIHLGPTAMVEFVAGDLTKDMEITVEAFRTEKMKDGHYVAKSLSYGDRTVTLRDENLRPVWAGGSAGVRGRGGPPLGPGRGQGLGYGRGCGWRCRLGCGGGPAWDLGPVPGRGYCPGYGRGYGPGYGRGAGQAQGFGYGRGLGGQR